VLWLDTGAAREIGPPPSIIQAYSRQRSSDDRAVSLLERNRPNWVRKKAIVQEISCRTEHGNIWSYPFGSILDFECAIAVKSRISALSFAYAIFSSSGFEIASARAQLEGLSPYFEPGDYKVRVCIPHLRLAPQNYSINLGIKSESGDEDFVADAAAFEVIPNEKSAAQFSDQIAAACIPQTDFAIENMDAPISISAVSCAL
jgi:hypothetical protein